MNKHLQAHMKKENNPDVQFILKARLEEIASLVRLRKPKSDDVVPSCKKNRPIKEPRVVFYRPGAGKLLVWYRYRKRKLLKYFGLTNSGQYTMSLYDKRMLDKYKYVKDNLIMYRCNKCGKICKTPPGFKYHMFSSHNVKVGLIQEKRQRTRPKANTSQVKESGKERHERSPAEREKRDIIFGFLQTYRRENRYYCDKCDHSNILGKQVEFREHLYKNHNVYHPDLTHYECTRCKPVLRTVKQNKVEAHIRSWQHVKLEKKGMGISDISNSDNEMDDESDTYPKQRQKRHDLNRIVSQYQIGSTFVCPQCQKTMERINGFVNHMYCEHKVKLSTKHWTYYECVNCSPAFRTIIKAKFEKHKDCSRHKRALELNKGTKRSNSTSDDDEPVRKKSKVASDCKVEQSRSISMLQSEELYCDFCKSNFSSVNDVGNHLDTYHKKHLQRFKYKCLICQAEFDTLVEFREHMKTEDHELEVALARSRAEYESTGNIVPDVENNNDAAVGTASDGESEQESGTVFKITNKGIECATCKMKTTVFNEFKSHIRQSHATSEDFSFSCSPCNFENSNVKEAMVHVASFDHETSMKRTFDEYDGIRTNLAYKIPRKNQIFCLVCKQKMPIEKLSSHAEEKHQISGKILTVHCKPCNEILSLMQVQIHCKSVKHQAKLANASDTLSDTDSCPPSKKQKFEVSENSCSEVNAPGPSAGNVTNISVSEPHKQTNTVEPTNAAANVKQKVVAPQIEVPLQPERVEKEMESSIHLDDDMDHDPFQPPSPEPVDLEEPEPIQEEEEEPRLESPPAQELHQEQHIAAAASQDVGGNVALNAQSVYLRQLTLDDFTSEELYEELCRRKSFSTCDCGFAFYDDKVAEHLHRGCHSVSDWHKCRFCLVTFKDAYKFTTHFFEGHKETRSKSTNF